MTEVCSARELKGGAPPGRPARPAIRAIAVASGKGGVGKTNVVANLAVALRRQGQRVIVVDADLGLANLDVLLGLSPRRTLRDVLAGRCTVDEIVVEGPEGLHLIPAASGFEELTSLGAGERLVLLNEIDSLEGKYDFMLIDVAAGISSNVLYFAMAAQEVLVVLTPEPTSLTDAYALVKVLARRHNQREFSILVNMVRDEADAKRTFWQLNKVTDRFLGVNLSLAGCIPYDQQILRAVKRQTTVLALAPNCAASRSLAHLAEKMLRQPPPCLASGGLQFFFRSLLAQRCTVG